MTEKATVFVWGPPAWRTLVTDRLNVLLDGQPPPFEKAQVFERPTQSDEPMWEVPTFNHYDEVSMAMQILKAEFIGAQSVGANDDHRIPLRTAKAVGITKFTIEIVDVGPIAVKCTIDPDGDAPKREFQAVDSNVYLDLSNEHAFVFNPNTTKLQAVDPPAPAPAPAPTESDSEEEEC